MALRGLAGGAAGAAAYSVYRDSDGGILTKDGVVAHLYEALTRTGSKISPQEVRGAIESALGVPVSMLRRGAGADACKMVLLTNDPW
jgi:hypothetical protein